MTPHNPYNCFINELESIDKNNSLRSLKIIEKRDKKYIICNGKEFLNLSSNDYLGLASDRELLNEFYSKLNYNNIINSYGLGSTSSRLLTGNYMLYSDLEKKIAGTYNEVITNSDINIETEKKALVFNSGYHANTGIIPAITSKNDLILSDKLNHASIIDGVRLSRAGCFIYEHLNYEQIERLLEENRHHYENVLIVSETLFSMDGDIADINKLVEIKKRYNAMLFIDEAHAVGLYGSTGLGICEEKNLIDDIDIIVATFGKALASQGAYAVTNEILNKYLVNRMRTLIFTTALPPVTVNWNLFLMERIAGYREKRKYLQNLADKLRTALNNRGIKTKGKSQIIPAIIGENKKTVQISEKLQENGFLLFPIRPPTVPEGSSRIRISLTADILWDDIKNIPEIIKGSLNN